MSGAAFTSTSKVFIVGAAMTAVLGLVAGCGGGSSPGSLTTASTQPPATASTAGPTSVIRASMTAPPTVGTTLRRTAPPATHVTVSGTGSDGRGHLVGGILVAFRPDDGSTGCVACGLVTATTDTSGQYDLSLPAGDYLVVCAKLPTPCQPLTPAGAQAGRVHVGGSELRLDVVLSAAESSAATTEPAAPSDLADPSAEASKILDGLDDNPGGGSSGDDGSGSGAGTDDGSGSGGSSSATFSGTVTDASGRPVAGIALEFKTVIGSNLSVDSDAQGRYAINLPAGVYNALCVPSSFDVNCGPRGGDGGPHPVDVPPQGQHLDFIVCDTAAYPGCLRR